MAGIRAISDPTGAGDFDHDATVIEVARFRRRAATPAPRDTVADDWSDEPTLVIDLDAVGPAPDDEEDDDDDATVIEPAPSITLDPEPPIPAPAPQPAPLNQLFAEPPALPREAGPAARPPIDRRRRKRNLMLACTVLAGAWVTLRPAAPARPRVSRVLEVRPAHAQIAPAPLPTITVPASPDLRTAANALAASRYADALAHYRGLAVLHPEQPVYAIIAGILNHELEDRCRAGLEESCR